MQAVWAASPPLLSLLFRDASVCSNALASNDAVLDPVSHLPLKIDCRSKTFTSKERRGGSVSEGGLQDHLLFTLHCQHFLSCNQLCCSQGPGSFHREVKGGSLGCRGWDPPHLQSWMCLRHLPHAFHLLPVRLRQKKINRIHCFTEEQAASMPLW